MSWLVKEEGFHWITGNASAPFILDAHRVRRGGCKARLLCSLASWRLGDDDDAILYYTIHTTMRFVGSDPI